MYTISTKVMYARKSSKLIGVFETFEDALDWGTSVFGLPAYMGGTNCWTINEIESTETYRRRRSSKW